MLILKNIQPNIDYQKGGEKRAPKFPMPAVWEYLLYYNYLSKNEKALGAVTTTLNNMAMGGIYDHIGGGFAGTQRMHELRVLCISFIKEVSICNARLKRRHNYIGIFLDFVGVLH